MEGLPHAKVKNTGCAFFSFRFVRTWKILQKFEDLSQATMKRKKGWGALRRLQVACHSFSGFPHGKYRIAHGKSRLQLTRSLALYLADRHSLPMFLVSKQRQARPASFQLGRHPIPCIALSSAPNAFRLPFSSIFPSVSPLLLFRNPGSTQQSKRLPRRSEPKGVQGGLSSEDTNCPNRIERTNRRLRLRSGKRGLLGPGSVTRRGWSE